MPVCLCVLASIWPQHHLHKLQQFLFFFSKAWALAGGCVCVCVCMWECFCMRSIIFSLLNCWSLFFLGHFVRVSTFISKYICMYIIHFLSHADGFYGCVEAKIEMLHIPYSINWYWNKDLHLSRLLRLFLWHHAHTHPHQTVLFGRIANHLE